jgi:hypothetical protein
MPLALFIAALVLALIEEFQARGRSLLGWAVVLVCIGLLYPTLT